MFIVAILAFCILFYFTNSLPINLIMVAIWYWNEVFYFLLHSKAAFTTFYLGLLFIPVASTEWTFYLMPAMLRPHWFGCSCPFLNQIMRYIAYLWSVASALYHATSCVCGWGDSTCMYNIERLIRCSAYQQTERLAVQHTNKHTDWCFSIVTERLTGCLTSQQTEWLAVQHSNKLTDCFA